MAGYHCLLLAGCWNLLTEHTHEHHQGSNKRLALHGVDGGVGGATIVFVGINPPPLDYVVVLL